MPFTDSKGITPPPTSHQPWKTWRSSSLSNSGGREAGGTQILKGTTLKEMQRVHWLQPNWKSGYGLGFSIWRIGEKTMVGHGGWSADTGRKSAFAP